MGRRGWIAVLGYGALAAAMLGCLWLIGLAPLRSNWGRELAGAAIAIVAMAIGLRLAQPRGGPRPAAPPEVLAGGTAPSSASAPTAPELSMREREVLAALARGLTNKELARTLGVSENTVKTHLANLYAKLGATRRTEALARARHFGLETGS